MRTIQTLHVLLSRNVNFILVFSSEAENLKMSKSGGPEIHAKAISSQKVFADQERLKHEDYKNTILFDFVVALSILL